MNFEIEQLTARCELIERARTQLVALGVSAGLLADIDADLQAVRAALRKAIKAWIASSN
jgi:hypothetical protein